MGHWCTTHSRNAFHPDVLHGMGLKPRHGSLDSCDNLGRRVGNGHEQRHDGGGLGTAERSQFVGTCRSRGKGVLVMLGTPDRRLAVDTDLGLEDAADAFVKRGACLLTAIPLVGHAVGYFLPGEFQDVGTVLCLHGQQPGEQATEEGKDLCFHIRRLLSIQSHLHLQKYINIAGKMGYFCVFYV